MPATIPGAAFSILLAMGAIVAAWGAYWIYSGKRTRGGVMLVIGVLLLLAGPAGLGWFRAPLIGQAVGVTLAIGALASAAEFWVRSQRAQTQSGQQPQGAAPPTRLASAIPRTHDRYSLGLDDGPESENDEAAKSPTNRERQASRVPAPKSTRRARGSSSARVARRAP